MDDDFKLCGALCPCVDQLYSPVEVLHILAIHLEKGCQLLQDVTNAWVAVPRVEAGADMVLLILPQVSNLRKKAIFQLAYFSGNAAYITGQRG